MICLMYIIQEVIDNVVDEVLVGYVKKIVVIVWVDGVIEVSDNGCGILVEIYFEEGWLVVELVFFKLYVGGKFNKKEVGNVYCFFGGLYGVGVLVINVLLICLEVEIKCGGGVYCMVFGVGFVIEELS